MRVVKSFKFADLSTAVSVVTTADPVFLLEGIVTKSEAAAISFPSFNRK